MIAGLSEGKALRSSVGTPPWVRFCLPIFTFCGNRQLLYLTLNGREGLRGSSKKNELYGENTLEYPNSVQRGDTAYLRFDKFVDILQGLRLEAL